MAADLVTSSLSLSIDEAACRSHSLVNFRLAPDFGCLVEKQVGLCDTELFRSRSLSEPEL